MVLVDDNEYRGSIEKNPFNSKHFNASQVSIYLNVEMPCPPLKLNFTDKSLPNSINLIMYMKFDNNVFVEGLLRNTTLCQTEN